MKKILLTMFLILCNVLALSAQNGGAIKGDAYFNQRVVGLKKAGTLEQEVTSHFSDVYVGKRRNTERPSLCQSH